MEETLVLQWQDMDIWFIIKFISEVHVQYIQDVLYTFLIWPNLTMYVLLMLRVFTFYPQGIIRDLSSHTPLEFVELSRFQEHLWKFCSFLRCDFVNDSSHNLVFLHHFGSASSLHNKYI